MVWSRRATRLEYADGPVKSARVAAQVRPPFVEYLTVIFDLDSLLAGFENNK